MNKRKYLLPLAVLANALTATQSHANSIDSVSIDNQEKSKLLEIETAEINKFDFSDKSALKFILKPNSDGIFTLITTLIRRIADIPRIVHTHLVIK